MTMVARQWSQVEIEVTGPELDGEGRVPSKYWLIDPRTGKVRRAGDRPADRVPIDVDDHEPTVLVCAETTPSWVRTSGQMSGEKAHTALIFSTWHHET